MEQRKIWIRIALEQDSRAALLGEVVYGVAKNEEDVLLIIMGTGVGDLVLVPPSWAHSTIVADISENMAFGAWCVRDYGFEYDEVRAHNGLAFYPIVDGDKIIFKINSNYKYSELIVKKPRIYKEFGLEQSKSIYTQFKENPDKFLFISKPNLAEDKFVNFIP